MEFLSALALVMLTLVGYASGMALVGRERERDVQPFIWDLLLVVGLWVAAFRYRGVIGEGLSLLVWLVAALILGAALTAVRVAGQPAAMPKSELPEHVLKLDSLTAAIPQNPFRRAWEAWKAFAADMGNVQGRFLMGFFYFIIVTPFGLAFRLFSDSLGMKKVPPNSGWSVKEPLGVTLEEAQEQG